MPLPVQIPRLHRVRTDARLLELPGEQEMTLVRVGFLPGSTVSTVTRAKNVNGTIRIAGAAFTIPVDQTIVHEIGHNWDASHENSTIGTFQRLSDCRSHAVRLSVPTGYTRASDVNGSNQPWIYRRGTAFARPEGEINPLEDIATCLEAYYSGNDPPRKWQAKGDYIDGFLKGPLS